MKIALVGPVYPYRGGIAHFTVSLADELNRAGHQVQVISFARQYPMWLYPGESDKDPSLRYEQVPAQYILDPIYFWTWGKAVRKICDFQPDLVIIQWWITFWGPAFAYLGAELKRKGAPFIFCIHNVIPHENHSPDRWLARHVLSKARYYITLSPRETLRLKALIPSAQVFTSRLPVPRASAPAMDRATARQILGIPVEQTVLLLFGIIRPYKGLGVLLEALGLLRAEGICPILQIVGEFWDDPEKYRQQIARLGIDSQVKIEARYIPNEEIETFYRAADCFVAPYLAGTQSGAIKMAIRYSLPVLVSSQIGGDLPEDYPVKVHQAGDVKNLAAHIRELVQGIWPAAGIQPGYGSEDWDRLVALIEQIGSGL